MSEDDQDRRRDLRDILDELDSYMERFEKDVQETVRGAISKSGLKDKSFVAGFSFAIGPEGKPSVQLFGDSPVRSDGHRAPLTEQLLNQKDATLKLVVDMPGVEKSDIKVEATEDSATVIAERGARKYRADVRLKARVKPEEAKAEYKNGLLEISFPLKDNANKDYRSVSVN